MSNDGCKNWMKEKGMLKHWILPEAGLNANAPCSAQPPGNSLEINPLDCALLKDLDDGMRQHVLRTHNLPDEDPKRFSLLAPKRLMSSHIRAWKTHPPSNCIAQDVTKCLLMNLGEICKHGRAGAPNLGNSAGKRNAACSATSKN